MLGKLVPSETATVTHCNQLRGTTCGSDSKLTFYEIEQLISLEVLVPFGCCKNWLGACVLVYNCGKGECVRWNNTCWKKKMKTGQSHSKKNPGKIPHVFQNWAMCSRAFSEAVTTWLAQSQSQATVLWHTVKSRLKTRMKRRPRPLKLQGHSKTTSVVTVVSRLSDWIWPCRRWLEVSEKLKQWRTHGSGPNTFDRRRKCWGVAEISQF